MIKKILFFYKTYIKKYGTITYSQEGEDIILRKVFRNISNGFYVDVGALHPKRFSNTHFFYKKGWRGINIDATPGSMEVFNFYRKRDINLELAISNSNDNYKFYIFDDPALNTFNKELASAKAKIDKYKLINTIEIKTCPLVYILDQYVPKAITIDLLSVDVEGHDYNVLLSNDWKRYSPSVVLVEDLNKSITDVIVGKIYLFLEGKGYLLYAKTASSSIFIKTNFFKNI